MDPISLMSSAASLVGMGMQLFGQSSASSASKQISADQIAILQNEEKENQVRQSAMQLSARRVMLQNIRQTQIARATGMAASVNQGAQFGSGTGGGQGQAAAQGATNTAGISQNLLIGNQMFSIDNNIDNIKMSMGNSMTDFSNAEGMMSLGGSLAKSGPTLGKIAGNLGGSIFSSLNNMFAPDLGFSGS